MPTDKALPNVQQTINLPNPKEVQVQQQQQTAEQMMQPVDIQRNDDGSADITFDPSTANPGQGAGHFSNLADLLPDDVLDPLGSKLHTDYQDYKNSRKDWERSYTSGLDLLGFKYDDRNEPFKGASGATHPVLAEAVTQFQSLAYKELLPSGGPVPQGLNIKYKTVKTITEKINANRQSFTKRTANYKPT